MVTGIDKLVRGVLIGRRLRWNRWRAYNRRRLRRGQCDWGGCGGTVWAVAGREPKQPANKMTSATRMA